MNDDHIAQAPRPDGVTAPRRLSGVSPTVWGLGITSLRLDQIAEVKALMEQLQHVSLGWILFALAIVPGICEEFFFRGVLFSSLRRVTSPWRTIIATAVLFGPDGNFLTSGRAALDFTSLAPGDESPFVIAVPVNGTVARYRVGFRAPDGSVIAHVDRRADSTAAEHSQVPRSTPWPH